MQWLFVVGLQLVLVFAVELFFGQVEIQCDLFVLLELHDDKGVARLALSQWGIQANAEHEVEIVRLRQHHEFLDCVVLDLVVVCLAPETK